MLRYIEQNGSRALEYRPEPRQRQDDGSFPFDNRFSAETRIFPIGSDGAPVCVNEIVCRKRTGGSYIYSNNPEMLAPEDVGAALLRSTHMQGRYMFTFEHSNHTGQTVWLGYQLYNAGDTPVTATVYNIGYQTDGEWLGQRSWSDYFNLEFRLPAEYFLPDGSVNPIYVGCDYVSYTPRRYEAQQVIIPPGAYIYLFGGTTADAYAHTDIGGTADRPVGTGKCCNGAMLFELQGGDPTGTFYCYSDPAQVQAAPPEQGYIVTRSGRNYAAQYQGHRSRTHRLAGNRDHLGCRRRDTGTDTGALHQPPRSEMAEQKDTLRRLCTAILYLHERQLAVGAQSQHQSRSHRRRYDDLRLHHA